MTKSGSYLKQKATESAIYGAVIASFAIIIATFSAAYFSHGGITLDSISSIQKTNIALWFLDFMPFIFMLWGQQTGLSLANEADSMVLKKTDEIWRETQHFRDKIVEEHKYDSLTKLINSKQFLVKIDDAIEEIETTNHDSNSFVQTISGYVSSKSVIKHQLSVILLDIENFKEINHTFGSNSGDLLLTNISTRLSHFFKQSNLILARVGGDDFGFLLTQTNENNTIAAIEKINTLFKEPFEVNGFSITLEISIGSCLFPQHGETAQALLQHAEVAMYACKQNANNYVFYSPMMSKYNIDDLLLKSEIRKAFDDDQLHLFYQPKVNRKGQVDEVEALVRWIHPKKGLISPDTFIPIIIQKRLHNELLQRILKLALQQAKKWQQDNIKLRIALNLTSFDLLNPKLPQLIQNELCRHQLGSETLKLEITETSLIENQALTLATLYQIAEMGISTSIDDFGTGYSSLAYLTSLPVDEIKIDQSFVKDMTTNQRNHKIIQAIIALAHSLSLSVVAEGVEDAKTLKCLNDLKCDYIQGYFFSKPLNAQDFTLWIKQWKQRSNKKTAKK